MSDLSHYRNQVTELGKKAVQAEADKNYTEAYENYVAALNIFKHLIKCKWIISNFVLIFVLKIDEKNPNLKTIYMEKMKQYLDRAEYIKKTALKAPDTQIAPKEEEP